MNRISNVAWSVLVGLGLAGCSSSMTTTDAGDSGTTPDVLDAVSPVDVLDAVNPLDALDAIDATGSTDAGDAGSATDANGADGGFPIAPLYRSGTRLRARVSDGGNGAVRFEGFHDTQLDVDCSFGTATDGQWRCMPNASDTLVFLDAACTQPAAMRSIFNAACPDTGNPWVYGPSDLSPACLTYSYGAVYRSAEPPLSTTTYYQQTVNGCQQSVISQGQTLRAVTAATVDTFVAATLGLEPHSDGLAAEVLTATDGARYVTAAHDTTHDRTCMPVGRYYGTGDGRCVGRHAFVSPFLYADATCSERIGFAGGNCMPVVAMIFENNGCTGSAALYSVMGPAPAQAYSNASGSCMPTAPMTQPLWQLGARLGSTDLPALSRVEVGTGRLRALSFGADGSPITQTPLLHFHDTTLDVDCVPYLVGGENRCVPVTAPFDDGSSFADAQCTHPLVQYSRGTTACPQSGPALVYRPQYDACTLTGGDVYATGAVYTGSSYSNASGTCTLNTDAPDTGYLELGARLDPTMFAPVQTVTE